MTTYDDIVAMYKDHPEYAEMGIFAGYGEFDEPTHEEAKAEVRRILEEVQIDLAGQGKR